MNHERTRRVGRNEALYRQVNERIEDLNDAFAAITGDFAIVCECGDLHCVEQITVSRQLYEQVRADPHRFIVKRGHEAADIEQPDERHDDYVVVVKDEGVPKRIAADTDPRS